LVIGRHLKGAVVERSHNNGKVGIKFSGSVNKGLDNGGTAIEERLLDVTFRKIGEHFCRHESFLVKYLLDSTRAQEGSNLQNGHEVEIGWLYTKNEEKMKGGEAWHEKKLLIQLS
jgi:hypothetical protein